MRIYFVLLGIFLMDHSMTGAEQIDPPIPCTKDEDCKMLSKNQKDPICKENYCVCTNEQQQLKNCSGLGMMTSHEKIIGSQVHHPCKLDIQCNFNHSFCNTARNQCDCQKGYVPSMEKQQCLQVARSLSFPCTEDKQCHAFQANTTCQQQQCVCVTGYHAVENVCWKMAPFGGACTKSEECNHINGAVCTDKNICGCEEKAFIDKAARNCVSYPKKIGDYCTNDTQCSVTIGNSFCDHEKCQCMKENHFVEEIGKCIPNRAIDEPCKHNYDCYQFGNDTNKMSKALQCIGSLCDCGINYLRNGDECVSAGTPSAHYSFIIILSTIIYGLFLQ